MNGLKRRAKRKPGPLVAHFADRRVPGGQPVGTQQSLRVESPERISVLLLVVNDPFLKGAADAGTHLGRRPDGRHV